MSRILSAILSFVAAANLLAAAPPHDKIVVDGVELSLTFEDNFSGKTLDLTKWERVPEVHRQTLNNYWNDEMTTLDGEGNLVISMTYDPLSDRFNSGGVRSKGLFEQAYGFYEIRCTLNTVAGYWTAFWLMTDSVLCEQNGGVDGTEIDIMESAFFSQSRIQYTLNWDGYGDKHKSDGVQVYRENMYDGSYHTFSLLWTPKEYIFYIDGEESWRTDAAKAEGVCEVPCYLKITSEMGLWIEPPDPNDLPNAFKVDYVRVYSANAS